MSRENKAPKKTRSSAALKKKSFNLWWLVPFEVILLCFGLALIYQAQQDPAKKAKATTQTTETTKEEKEKRTSTTPSTPAETASSTTNSTTSSTESVVSPLLRGTNHNEQAENYAYSAQEVQEIMDGKRAPFTGERICFLTFDDGVNTTITPKILDVLKEEKVPATFFVIGQSLGGENIPILKRELNEGHGIGLHSYYHNYDVLYPGSIANANQIVNEANKSQEVLQSIFGKGFYTGVWRYPGGHMSWKNIQAADGLLAQKNIHYVDWNAMSGDAQPTGDRPTTPEAMVDYQAHSITEYPDVHLRVVLMHDAMDKNVTVEALPGIIKFYKDHGFTFGILK